MTTEPLDYDSSGPAFPEIAPDCGFGRPAHYEPGLTMRMWFAGQAMQGLLAHSYCDPMRGTYVNNCDAQGVAQVAFGYADAMAFVAERGRENTKELIAEVETLRERVEAMNDVFARIRKTVGGNGMNPTPLEQEAPDGPWLPCSLMCEIDRVMNQEHRE